MASAHELDGVREGPCWNSGERRKVLRAWHAEPALLQAGVEGQGEGAEEEPHTWPPAQRAAPGRIHGTPGGLWGTAENQQL